MAKDKEDKSIADSEISTTQLAATLGLTARRVQQLAQDGILVPIKRGRFCLGESVRKYIEFINPKKDSGSQSEEKLEAEIRIKKSKAIISEMEAKELQGKMHRSDDVQAMTEQLVYTIRGMMVALPGRLAADVSSVNDAAEAGAIIQAEVFKIMGELSRFQYDPKKYKELVRERKNWDQYEYEEE